MLKYPKGVVGNKKRMENNTGGSSNTALENSSGSATIQKTTEIGSAPHQAAEEALSHQARDTATIS